MWAGVTVTCFAASYLVSFVLEFSRLFFRAPVRLFVMVGFAAAGLFAHTLYLAAQAGSGQGPPLSSWRDWCLILAWILAAFYIAAAVRRPRTSIGLFLLPIILAIIALAELVYGPEPFGREEAVLRWAIVHGAALLLGTIIVTLGFVAGLMYLVQSYRLKHKKPIRQGFRLPSLEWLQRVNKQAFICSVFFIALGMAAGIVLNAIEDSMAWSNPVAVASGVLMIWLAFAMLLEYFYRPARQGRKVAYITVISFVMLGLVMAFVLYTQHARSQSAEPTPQDAAQPPRQSAQQPDARLAPRTIASLRGS